MVCDFIAKFLVHLVLTLMLVITMYSLNHFRNEDLKLMLDGSKDSLKLEAMKRIIGMIAKGRDASDL